MKLTLLLTAAARARPGDVLVQSWPPGPSHRFAFASQVPDCPLIPVPRGKKPLA